VLKCRDFVVDARSRTFVRTTRSGGVRTGGLSEGHRDQEGAPPMRLITILVTVAALAVAAPAIADKGGKPHGGNSTSSDPSCSVDPNSVAVGDTYVLSASGLPTGVAINLWVTDPNGNTSGSPLGSTPDGTFAMNESSSSAGPWTYTFSGPTKNNPDTTATYASCSVVAY
jgi:hypothetical protein